MPPCYALLLRLFSAVYDICLRYDVSPDTPSAHYAVATLLMLRASAGDRCAMINTTLDMLFMFDTRVQQRSRSASAYVAQQACALEVLTARACCATLVTSRVTARAALMSSAFMRDAFVSPLVLRYTLAVRHLHCRRFRSFSARDGCYCVLLSIGSSALICYA